MAQFFQRLTKQWTGKLVAGPFFGRVGLNNTSCIDLGIEVYTPFTKVEVFDQVYFWVTITNHGKHEVTDVKTYIKANSELELLGVTEQMGQYISGVWAIEYIGPGKSYNIKLDFEVKSTNEYKPMIVQAMIANSSKCDSNLWNNFEADGVYVYDYYYIDAETPVELVIDW